VYDWGEPQRFKFCVIFRGEMGFVYRFARTTFLSQPVFIFNAKTFNKSIFFKLPKDFHNFKIVFRYSLDF
jgi:hypothetical protein